MSLSCDIDQKVIFHEVEKLGARCEGLVSGVVVYDSIVEVLVQTPYVQVLRRTKLSIWKLLNALVFPLGGTLVDNAAPQLY
jgi:hypothetical protein